MVSGEATLTISNQPCRADGEVRCDLHRLLVYSLLPIRSFVAASGRHAVKYSRLTYKVLCELFCKINGRRGSVAEAEKRTGDFDGSIRSETSAGGCPALGRRISSECKDYLCGVLGYELSHKQNLGARLTDPRGV